MSGLLNIGRLGLWTAADRIQIGLYVLQDVDRWSLLRDRSSLVANEEQRKLRHDLLAELGAEEVFSAGAALLTGPDGRPDPRPVSAAVTPAEIVLLDADVQQAPETEVARIPRREISGVRLLGEHGDPINPVDLDEAAELEAPRDRRYVVWVDRQVGGSSGAHAFVFFAPSVAAEAARDFERARLT